MMCARQLEQSDRKSKTDVLNEELCRIFLQLRSSAITEEEAFCEIIRMTQGPVLAVLRAHGIRSKADQDDLFQQYLLRVKLSESSTARYKTSEPFLPWAYRIARNLSYSFLKSQLHREVPLLYLNTIAAETPNNTVDLLAVLDRMSLEHREVLVAKFYEGVTTAQLATQLKVPDSTISGRLRAAKIKLKEMLNGKDPDPPPSGPSGNSGSKSYKRPQRVGANEEYAVLRDEDLQKLFNTLPLPEDTVVSVDRRESAIAAFRETLRESEQKKRFSFSRNLTTPLMFLVSMGILGLVGGARYLTELAVWKTIKAILWSLVPPHYKAVASAGVAVAATVLLITIPFREDYKRENLVAIEPQSPPELPRSIGRGSIPQRQPLERGQTSAPFRLEPKSVPPDRETLRTFGVSLVPRQLLLNTGGVTGSASSYAPKVRVTQDICGWPQQVDPAAVAALRIKTETSRNSADFDQLAAMLVMQGEFEAAVEFYREAAKLNPTSPAHQNNLGTTLQFAGRWREAEEIYQQTIKASPNYVTTYLNLASLLDDLGRHNQVISLYRKAISINADIPDGYINLGAYYEKLGDVQTAERLYRQAILLDPSSIGAFNHLAKLLTKVGRIGDGQETFRVVDRLCTQ